MTPRLRALGLVKEAAVHHSELCLDSCTLNPSESTLTEASPGESESAWTEASLCLSIACALPSLSLRRALGVTRMF